MSPFLTLGSVALAILTPSGVALGVLNPASIAWNGKEVMALSEAIFTSVFVNPEISEFHTIVPGIVAKQQIAFLGLLGLVGKSGSGCSPEADTPTASLTQKFWEPAPIGLRIEECYTTYNASFFIWAQNKGVKRADLTNTDVFNFIEERSVTGMNEAKLRHAWFGDTDAANYNSSPAGIVTNGVDVDYFNSVDGFFKQMYAIVAADSTKLTSIALNAQASYAAQRFDSTDTTNKLVMGIMDTMRTEADTRLSDRDDTIFIVTKSVYDQLVREYKSYTAIESSYQLNKDGVRELMFDGVPVRKFSFWDRTINAYFNNGTKWYQPHRIVYTVKSNLQIGVESEEALNGMDVFYDKKTKLNILDAEFLMDAKVIEDYMVQVAY
ncbi:MAG: hypothetical protein V4549_18200 [Bacteroidota bacterium]